MGRRVIQLCKLILVLRGLTGATGLAMAQLPTESEKAAVPLRIKVEEGRTVLSWDAPAGREVWSYTLYRRSFPPATDWGKPLSSLPAESLSWEEGSPGTSAWEYRIVALDKGTGQTSYGYAIFPQQRADVDERKAILLLVSEEVDEDPQNALIDLRRCLQWRGWVVRQRVVPQGHKPATVRALVQAEAADLGKMGVPLKTVQILGRVAVPYSGNLAPDGHADHWGAWPTDLYYGDLDGAWPDERDFAPQATDPRQHNLAGDGKFDLNELPGRVEVSVGRVDFSSLTPLDLQRGSTEKEAREEGLVRIRAWIERVSERYMMDEPAFGEIGLQDLMTDNAEGFAAGAWRLAPLLPGSGQPIRKTLLGGEPGLAVGFGFAPGTYDSAMGVVNSTQLLWGGPGFQIPLVFLFGSYFGDWDAPGNLLQATLGSRHGKVLAAAWGARPGWQLHPLAAGYTLGDCQLLTANRTQDYLPGLREAYPVHLGLLGDPTLELIKLRTCIVRRSEKGLTWSLGEASSGQVDAFPAEPLGWHVYVWDSPEMAPRRVTTELQPLSRTEFPLSAQPGARYQVRLLYRVRTPAGVVERLAPGRVLLSSG